MYHIAGQLGVKPISIHLKAPPEVVYVRLEGPLKGVDPEDNSSADWQVYERMSTLAGPIKRNHYVVDTSRDIGPAISKVVREIRRWMRTQG